MLDEKMKELKDQQNYAEMVTLLRKYEANATQWYTQLSSILSEQDPTMTGIFLALEQISISMTSLLRKCNTLLEDGITSIPLEAEPSMSIAVGETSTRERDDKFTLNKLKAILENLPSQELTKDDQEELKFWYIISGKNESREISLSKKEYFGKALTNAIDQIGISSDEKFSISPLGYEALLSTQMQSTVSQIVKSYGNEFTLIKLYE